MISSTLSPDQIQIQIRPMPLEQSDAAWRLGRLAFGTFMGMPSPEQFMGDREMITPRARSANVKVIAAYDGERLVGSNVVTRWGSLGFFGPLTIHPDLWDRGVAQQLLASTEGVFDEWRVRHRALFTFPQSPKHLGLYMKFGYWPRFLTPVMTLGPESRSSSAPDARGDALELSRCDDATRRSAIEGCKNLAGELYPGLDLTEEIEAVLSQRIGEVLIVHGSTGVDALAICMHGPGSEGGEKLCYVKFAAARSGSGAGERFERLLDACEQWAFSRGLGIEAGVNLSHDDAYRRMRARGYRSLFVGVALHKPNEEGYCRPDAYVLDDWR